MQDAQLLLLPQRLRKKQSQRTSQDPLHSFSTSSSARGQSQNVWRPAGCHSVHTTGVEGVHQHPFSRPSSPGQTRKSCSNEASQTYDKENEVSTTRSSRVFKQTKGHDIYTKGTHPGQLLNQNPAHVNIHQGILHLPDPVSARGNRESRSPSPGRPALSTISNNCLNRPGSNSILQPAQQQNPKPTPHTAVYSSRHQWHQRTPHSQNSSCRESSCNRRFSCGSSSSCSGYTPGARGTHHVEYISPLHEGLRLHRQQQRQPELSPSSHHPASAYLHALGREIEQQHGQVFRSRNVSPLGYTGGVSQQQLHTPVAAPASKNPHTSGQQHPQRSPSTERAAGPVQLPDNIMAEEPEEAYYSPVLPHLHQHFKQQYHLTPCYADLEECDTVQQEECSSSKHQMQELVSPPWEESRAAVQPGSSQLPQRVSELLKPAATAPPRPLSPRQNSAQLVPPEVLYQQQSDLALGVQQQQLVGQEKSMCDAIPTAPCDQDTDWSPYRREHECQRQEQMDTDGLLKLQTNKMALMMSSLHDDVVPPDASHRQQHQQIADKSPSHPTPQEDLELQQRRQQWRAHQQAQQHQHWLSQLEIQQHQQRSSTPMAVGGSSYERQQHPQEPTAVASPAAAAAASAIADYRRIIGQAQAMAQKSEAAWAQLNKYHQHRVCGRLPGSSSANRSRTPTSVAGNRQLSRMGWPSANAAGTGNPAAAAGPVAVSPTPCKTLGSCLLQLSSPGVYHTPTGGLSSSSGSIRKPPAHPPAFLCNDPGPTATAAAAGGKYCELPSLPGSPAAAVKQDSNGSYAGGGRTPSMARQLNFGPAGATAAIIQSLRDSSKALRAAARASIAANLRSSCDATPNAVLPVLPDCSAFATQPTGVRGRDQCVGSSDNVVMPRTGSRRVSISHACLPLPSSPAWSVYLTPGAAEPASGGAAAAAITAAATDGDTVIARRAGLGSGNCLGSKGAWWRTPEDQISLLQQHLQLQQQGIGTLQYDSAPVAIPVANVTPSTGVRPRDLLDCFEGVEQLVAAQPGPDSAVYGARSAIAAAVNGDAGTHGSSDALSSSRSSIVEGFPFTPGSTRRPTFYGDNNSITKQHLAQLASHAAHNHNTPLASISPAAAAASRAFEPASQPAAQGSCKAGGGATWLHKYLDAKSAAVVTPDSSVGSVRSASMTCQGECAGISSPLDVEGMEASAFAADDDGLLGQDGGINEQKEAWTVHNNWVATGMDAVAESIEVAAAAIALCSMTDAVNVPKCSKACRSSNDHAAADPAAVPECASIEHTPMQPSSCNNLQQQEPCNKLGGSQPTSSNIFSTAIASVTATSSDPDTDNLQVDNLSPLLDNLTPAQALAAYTQLAQKLKQRMDETAGGLLARLNLRTPVPSCSTSARSSTDSMAKDAQPIDIAQGSTVVAREFQASLPAAVVCKQAVGMVVLSPHTACGRWQSSRAVPE